MSSNEDTTKSIETEFNIAQFKLQVQQMSEAQAKELLIKLYESSLVKEETYKKLIKHQWGL